MTTQLTGCATAGSEPPIAALCPPVVEYSSERQARAANELVLLPDGSAIPEIHADYGVMRDQARLEKTNSRFILGQAFQRWGSAVFSRRNTLRRFLY